VLDEPSAGLDPIVAAELDELILLLKQTLQMTVIVVTHELLSAFRIADRIAMLYQGSFSSIGTKDQIKASQNPRVRQFLDRIPEGIAKSSAVATHSYDPFNFHHLIHRTEAHYRGERVPEEDSFYEEITKDITPANEIVLIGHATGKSNAADFLKEYLKTHHPDISRRVIATESADLSAVTEPEIEALAKRHMIAVV